MAWDIEKAIIAAGYKTLAKKAHPDTGVESPEPMIALNAARDRLLELVTNFGEAYAAPVMHGPEFIHVAPPADPFNFPMGFKSYPPTPPEGPPPPPPLRIPPQIRKAVDQIFGRGASDLMILSFGSVEAFVQAFNNFEPKPPRSPRRRKS